MSKRDLPFDHYSLYLRRKTSIPSKAAGPAAKKAYAALQALGAGAGAAMRNEEEYLDEVEELKKELQEGMEFLENLKVK